MAEKKFSELETAANLDGSEYAAVSQSQSGVLTSVKATLQAIANWVASGSRYASALNTQDKTLTGAINEVLADAGSDVSVTNTIPSSDETKRVATVTVDGTPTDINADDTEAILRRVFGEHIVEGNPVTFDAYLGVETVKSLTLTMNPIQSGTGDPSPTNIRPISGRDSVDVVISDGETEETKTITFPSTIYGGTDEIVEGTGTSTMAIVDLGALNWTYSNAEGHERFNSSAISTLAKLPSTASDVGNIICSQYKTVSNIDNFSHVGGFSIALGQVGNGNIFVYDSNYTNASDFKTAMSGVQLCYELATSTPFSTTPTPIPLNKGNNVVSSDADDLELIYSVG